MVHLVWRLFPISPKWRNLMRHSMLTAVRAATIGLAAAAFAVAALAAPASAAPTGTILGEGSAKAIADSYIVVLNDGAGTKAEVPGVAKGLARKYSAAVDSVWQDALHGFHATMSEGQARRLATDPDVKYVEQDQETSIMDTQLNPPSWSLDRIDQRNLPLDNAYSYPGNGSGVTAYILDSGIRITHQDFGGRASWGANFMYDGRNTDCLGHGTHVAATVGGNAYGVAKGVHLVAVKVVGCSGDGTGASLVNGINWVTSQHTSGPAVANVSIGIDGYSQALNDAVTASIADGVVYAVSAGNDAVDACTESPGSTPRAITVGATDSGDNRAAFSNFGTCLDVFAPGVDITSAWNTSDTATAVDSGTSMASPQVAGAAALILAANPSLTVAQVRNQLVGAATANVVGNPGAGSLNRLLYVDQTCATYTWQAPKAFDIGETDINCTGMLAMQADGNLVMYNKAGIAIWATNTWGHPGAVAVFQADGNLVVSLAGVPLWASNTAPAATGGLLAYQTDGNLVIYNSAGVAVWATNTVH
jgi:subtilisin family serine protease